MADRDEEFAELAMGMSARGKEIANMALGLPENERKGMLWVMEQSLRKFEIENAKELFAQLQEEEAALERGEGRVYSLQEVTQLMEEARLAGRTADA